jgi:signal transduction histidine kinase
MTIRRQWLLVLVLMSVLAVLINTLILGALTDQSFTDYLTENYYIHLGQIESDLKSALSTDSYSNKQLQLDFETHLQEPIIAIRLFDTKGNLIVNVRESANDNQIRPNRMMGNRMMDYMMGSAGEETDNIKIEIDGRTVGYLEVVRYSSIENTFTGRLFKLNLWRNSLIAIGVVVVLAMILGLFVSKKTSKALIHTASQAQNIDLDETVDVSLSRIAEIRTIQERLFELERRLKLKQLGRKQVMDEIVHQVRTPMTILKNHIEGFEDGIVEQTHENYEICHNQIEHITSILSDMDKMLEVGGRDMIVNLETIDLSHLIEKVIKGISLQFKNKNIAIEVKGAGKLMVETDELLMSQVMYNLLTNAYKFTESGGLVRVEYSVAGDDVWIGISDTGCGIAKRDLDKLYDAYYRGENAIKSSGQGLGLYVVKENLARLDAEIMVQSSLGEGTIFTIRHPLNRHVV